MQLATPICGNHMHMQFLLVTFLHLVVNSCLTAEIKEMDTEISSIDVFSSAINSATIHTIPAPIFPLFVENKHASCSSRGSSGSSSASASTQQQQVPGPASDNSNSNNKGNGTVHPYPPRLRHSTSLSSCSEFTSVSQQPRPVMEPDRISVHSGRVGPANGGNLGVAAHLANSRESFQQALDNPCEYFIDVM